MNQSNGCQCVDSSQKEPVSAAAVSDKAADPSTDPIELDTSILRGTDFGWAIEALEAWRDDILSAWLEAASAQPFHRSHPDRVVSDDIPRLYDAVLEFLAQASSTWREPGAPMDHPSILEAANAHANARAEQGLQPRDVVTEFRLLRRAIWKGLRDQLGEMNSVENLVSAELLINDALDGAITVGLDKLSSRIEVIREDFLVSTVHDIRQPITAIKGLAQLSIRNLSRQNPEIDRVLSALADITTQVDQLNGTIDLLIDLSRAALGQLSLQLSFVDLARLVPEILQQNGLPHLREVRLTVPAEGLATGYWDLERLRQVIANMISNSLKYSPAASPIEIEVRATIDNVEVAVRDFGMGLEAEDLPKIFRRYYRTTRAIDSAAEGSGVGLFLCAQIIAAHDGKIWAESDGQDQGTTMRFSLPRNLQQETSSQRDEE